MGTARFLLGLPLIGLIFIAGFKSQDEKPPSLGVKAPELTFESVVGGNLSDWNLESLKGQVVVIEFSASWCGPCRITLPHLNKLAEDLKGKPIKFLCVTAEDKATAEKFKKDVKMTMPLAVDLDGATHERYWVTGIPDALVIDPKGTLVGRVHPDDIKAEDLIALTQGENVTFKNDLEAKTKRSWNPKSSAKLTAGTWMKKVDAKAQRLSVEPKKGVISFDGISSAAFLSFVFGHSVQEMEYSPKEVVNELFSGRIEAPDKNLETAKKILVAMAKEQLGVSIEKVQRTQKCYVLTKTSKFVLQKPTAPDSYSNMTMLGLCNMKYTTPEAFTMFVRDHVDRPIVDETGIGEPFSIKIAWDATKGFTELIKKCEEAGFKLESAEKPVAWFLIKKIG
jgi:uncharacterized protein (TIGR03435 family)